MKKQISIAAIGLALITNALAEDAKAPLVTGSATLEVYSKYLWRGINSNNEAILWPTVTVARGPWSAYVFGSMELTNTNTYGPTEKPAGKFTEYDLNLTYASKCGKLPVSLGFTQYNYPRTGNHRTGEAFATVCSPVEYCPTLSVYYDVERAHGLYAAISGSHEIGKVVGVAVNGVASLGYANKEHNAYYYGYDKSCFTDAWVGVNATLALSKRVSLTPSLKFTTLLDKHLLEGTSNRNNVVGGLSLTYSF